MRLLILTFAALLLSGCASHSPSEAAVDDFLGALKKGDNTLARTYVVEDQNFQAIQIADANASAHELMARLWKHMSFQVGKQYSGIQGVPMVPVQLKTVDLQKIIEEMESAKFPDTSQQAYLDRLDSADLPMKEARYEVQVYKEQQGWKIFNTGELDEALTGMSIPIQP